MEKYRILIVDDEPKVAFFFQKNLEMMEARYEVRAVNSGQAALTELQKKPFDLLITDLRMPQMDGLELLRQVRARSPQTKTILVTAYGSEDVWEQARQLEISQALSKPLKIPDLLTAVRRALAEGQRPGPKRYGLIALTGEHFEMLSARLENLRVDMGARACILADITGNILAQTGGIPEIDLPPTIALLGGNIAASVELSRQLRYPNTVHLAYYEGPPYDLYVANVGENFFLTTLYDRRKESSRIGLVWLYKRRALDDLAVLLNQDLNAPTQELFDPEFAANVQTELDSLFDDVDLGLAAAVAPAPTVAPTAAPAPAPTPAAPATAASQDDDLPQKTAALLRQFERQTGLPITTDLAGLSSALSPKATTFLFRLLTLTLKAVYRQPGVDGIHVAFWPDNVWQLNGEIAIAGNGAANLVIEGLRPLADQYNQSGGFLRDEQKAGSQRTIRFCLP
jgi:CheY-like chemotaxis protein